MQVKCGLCGTKQEKSEMYCDAGKQKKYFHHSCWPVEQQRREEVAKEKEGLGLLLNYVKTVHNLYDVPKPFIPFLQDIRNGTVRFQGPVQQKKKQGIPYDVILEAYRMSTDSIRWARANKDFTVGFPFSELKYGLRIVTGNLNRAMERCRAKERTSTLTVNAPIQDREATYKPRKADNDIADFLKE